MPPDESNAQTHDDRTIEGRYRVGGHWGITIIREGVQPADESGRRPDDQLVAVTMNNPALAGYICDLLNAHEFEASDFIMNPHGENT